MTPSTRPAAGLAGSLGAAFRGEVSASGEDRDFYSSAACIYEVRPEAAVWPADADDVERLVRAARETGLPITPRGAGSGVAGHSVGSGVVADLSRHMNRILEIDREEHRARVQPGVRLAELNAALRPEGLHFSPDPSSGGFCTIGGMIANNAGGAHSIQHGGTREHLISVSAVTGAGERLVTRERTRAQLAGGSHDDDNDRLAAALVGIAAISGDREEIIERYSMKTSRNSSGYDLRGALGAASAFDAARAAPPFDPGRGAPAVGVRRGIDLARLIAGSEGTLAIVTEATLALRPLPAARGTALALFEDLDRAGEAILRALPSRPACAELVSEALLRMMRADSALVREAVPEPARAFVIFEVDGDTEAEAAAGLERLRQDLVVRARLASGFTAVTAPEAKEAIWQVRHLASPTLTRHAGSRRNMRFIEDACVPPARLAEFLTALQRLFAREKIEAAIFGHAGDSLVHVNPLMDPDRGDLLARMESIAEEFAGIVQSFGGTLTGEHGDGRLRTPLLPRMFGPLYPIFGEVKSLFDPDGILNPGIIVAAPGTPARITDHVRLDPTPWRAPEA